MGFDEFIEANLWADWLLNLFKTLSPTFIALITIWINTKRERKKDSEQLEREEQRRNEDRKDEKKSKFVEMDRRAVDDIRNNALYVNTLIWDTGKELLEAIQRSQDKKISGKYLESFQEYNKKFLVEVRKLNGKADIYLASTGISEFDFQQLFKILTNISTEYIKVLEEYNDKASITPICQANILYDEVQEKLIQISTECENELISYSVQLENALKRYI